MRKHGPEYAIVIGWHLLIHGANMGTERIVCPFHWLQIGIGVASHQGRHCVSSRNVCMNHCLLSIAYFM
jgi:hypothetical protein